MQEPGRRPARCPERQHLELEWKEARRAEVQLHQRLQALEAARLVHAQLRAWEQTQLRKELRRLQEIIRKRKHSCAPKTLERPPQARGRGNTTQAEPPRALAAGPPQEAHAVRSRGLPALKDGPRHPAGSGQSPPPDSRGEKPPTPEPKAVDTPRPCQGGEGTPAPSPSREGGGGQPGDAHLVSESSAGDPQPVRAAPVPTDAEQLARAGRARYIRHRTAPAWEQLLSIREVFGHRDATAGTPRTPSPEKTTL